MAKVSMAFAELVEKGAQDRLARSRKLACFSLVKERGGRLRPESCVTSTTMLRR